MYVYNIYIYIYADMFDDLGDEELFVFSRDINKTVFSWSFITT